MADNKVAVEITLEERAALKALTSLTKEIQKTEDGFTSMGKKADKVTADLVKTLQMPSIPFKALGKQAEFSFGLLNKGAAESKTSIEKIGKASEESLGVFGKAADGLGSGFGSLVKGVTIANLASEAIIGTANSIKGFVLGSINAAVEQENAINRLRQAMMTMGDFTQSGLDDLVAYSSALQQNSKFGDEAVIAQLAVAKSMGLTNDQAKQLVQTAADLDARFGGGLDANVEKLGKTFSGSAGRLAQFIPELKDLTEQQLRSGAAVELLNKKFGGSAANELKTYEGQLIAMKNAASDFQEEIGGLVTGSDLAKNSLASLAGIFQKLTKDMADARVLSKIQNEGYVETGDELSVLYEKQDQLNRQLEKYNQIANSKGLDLRTLNDARSNVESLKDELTKLNLAIGISASAVQREQDKPTSGQAKSGRISESDQKIIDSRLAANAALQQAYIDQAAWEAEQDLMKRDITAENYQAELDQLNGIEQAKIDAKFAAEEAKLAIVKDSQTRQLQAQKLQVDKEMAIQQSQVANKKKIDQQFTALESQKQAAMAAAATAGLQLLATVAKDGSREQFLLSKAAAIAQAAMSTKVAYMQALAFPPGPPVTIPTANWVAAAGAANIASIVATAFKGYESGGIIPGNSYSGDNVIARVNSSEMILNRSQQTELFKMANGGGGNGGLSEKIDQLIAAIANRPVVISVDGRAIASVVRKEVQSGFKLA